MGFLDSNSNLSQLFYLLCAHALADYVFQTPKLGRLKQKNYRGKDRKIYGPWWWSMTAHALVNGFFVGYIMHWWVIGLLETAVHFGLDTMKSEKKIDRDQDQLGHLISKVVWTAIG